MKPVRKKLHKREIKKLRAIEIKREPFKKLDNNGKKKDEPEKVKEDSDFHEKILEKSMDLSAPTIKPEEELNKENTEKSVDQEEKINNLEEFASTLPSPERKIEEKPYSAASAYGPGGNSGTYDSDTRYDTGDRYDPGSVFNNDRVPGLRTETTNAFGTPVFGNRTDERGKEGLTANRLEESARLTQQYRRDREATSQENTAPHQSKKREIF